MVLPVADLAVAAGGVGAMFLDNSAGDLAFLLGTPVFAVTGLLGVFKVDECRDWVAAARRKWEMQVTEGRDQMTEKRTGGSTTVPPPTPPRKPDGQPGQRGGGGSK